MSQPIVIGNRNHEIKIYAVQNQAHVMYPLSNYEEGKQWGAGRHHLENGFVSPIQRLTFRSIE